MFDEKRPRRPRLVLQSEMGECGLACVAMLASAYGGSDQLEWYRGLHRGSSRGTSVRTLLELLRKLGFAASAVRVEPDSLRLLTLPAILHWNANHYVVLEKVAADGIRVLDPAGGPSSYAWQEVDGRLSGYALHVKDLKAVMPAGERRRWPQVAWARRFVPAAGVLAGALPSFIAEACTVILPASAYMLVDAGGHEPFIDRLGPLLAAFGLLILVRFAANVAQALASEDLRALMLYRMRSEVMLRVLTAPLAFIERRSSASMLSRLANLAPARDALQASVHALVMDGTLMLLVLAALWLLAPAAAALLLAVLLANGAARALFLGRLKMLRTRRIFAESEEQGMLIELLRAGASVRAFGKASTALKIWNVANVAHINAELDEGRVRSLSIAVGDMLADFSDLAFYAVAAFLAVTGRIEFGQFLMAALYKSIAFARFGVLFDRLQQLHSMGIVLDQNDELLRLPRWDPGDGSDPGHAEPFDSLAFDGVWFRYGQDEPWVLQGVSFEIRRGEKVALVGETGIGKSTIMKLMCGLIEPEQGEVRINGRTAGGLPLGQRCRIATMMQDDSLLRGSIVDNITFFSDHPDMEAVRHACAAACLDEEVDAMPMGYETIIDEFGSVLSGGQKQRLLLARALHAQPELLILDEGTSQVDVGTERRIADNLRRADMTIVNIAHRPETIQRADRVLAVGAGGAITEGGVR